MKRFALPSIMILFLTFLTYSHAVRAECIVNGGMAANTGTQGDDTIICDDTSPNSSVGGTGGSDTIIIEAGATVWDIAGDGRVVSGQVIPGDADVSVVSAPDTIIVAGNANNVYGDLDALFGGGDDNITITSTGHVSNVSGDSKWPIAALAPQMGNDTITIEAGAVVDNDVNGDTKGSDLEDQGVIPGNDTITVNGTVGGNVYGQPGDDTIIIGGTVGGTVDGGDGNDSVTLNEGANGGEDNNLVVNGGNDNDTLTFAFTITSEDDYNALANLIAANSPSGSITINGQTITWSNFEQLINALIANFGVGSEVTVKDNRLNGSDAGASALAYCTGSGVQVLGVDPTTAQGNEAFTVSTAQIQTALSEAQSTNTSIEITNAEGINLVITPDGKLVVTAPDISDASKTYQFSFEASVCGIS
jgi:hypothetical protein